MNMYTVFVLTGIAIMFIGNKANGQTFVTGCPGTNQYDVTIIQEKRTWYQAFRICHLLGHDGLDPGPTTSVRQRIMKDFLEQTVSNIPYEETMWTGNFRPEETSDQWFFSIPDEDCVPANRTLFHRSLTLREQCGFLDINITYSNSASQGVGGETFMSFVSDECDSRHYYACFRNESSVTFQGYEQHKVVHMPSNMYPISFSNMSLPFDVCQGRCADAYFCVGFEYNYNTLNCTHLQYQGNGLATFEIKPPLNGISFDRVVVVKQSCAFNVIPGSNLTVHSHTFPFPECQNSVTPTQTETRLALSSTEGYLTTSSGTPFSNSDIATPVSIPSKTILSTTQLAQSLFQPTASRSTYSPFVGATTENFGSMTPVSAFCSTITTSSLTSFNQTDSVTPVSVPESRSPTAVTTHLVGYETKDASFVVPASITEDSAEYSILTTVSPTMTSSYRTPSLMPTSIHFLASYSTSGAGSQVSTFSLTSTTVEIGMTTKTTHAVSITSQATATSPSIQQTTSPSTLVSLITTATATPIATAGSPNTPSLPSTAIAAAAVTSVTSSSTTTATTTAAAGQINTITNSINTRNVSCKDWKAVNTDFVKCPCTITKQTLEALLEKLTYDLTVDVSTTSKHRRKKTSAFDNRTDVFAVGIVGVVVIGTIVFLIMVSDFFRIGQKTKKSKVTGVEPHGQSEQCLQNRN